ncbi:MAG: SLBB domain-containing protein, partial [Rhodoferax sp.]|nr:SLBB domain-containing protein [Rhodoferax sp.]
SIPKVGPLTLAGTRADQMEALLKTHIARTFANFELSATLGRLRSMQVFVVGQARKPGVFTVSGLSTLISVLFESGGPTATGSLRKIQVVRAGKTVSTLDLYKFINNGDTTADLRLQPGDVIVIPPAGPRIALLGALDNPAIYELASPEETIAQVLGYSGGLQVLTSPHKALLERVNPAQGKAPRSVEDRVLNATGLATTVRDGDVLTLFKISPEFANAVTLRGNVAAPLRYAFRPGMKVSDLIPEPSALIQSDYYNRKNILVQYESGKSISAERVVTEVITRLEEINWDYAAVERVNTRDVRTELIPFNLAKAVKDQDPANNLTLQAGDVVTIFGVNDLPVPMEKRTQFVRIAGEVMVPGVYQIKPGDNLPGLIKRAGGLSSHAFAYGTVFTRESTRVQQQDNLNKSIRRMESDINSQTAAMLQNVIDTEKGAAVQSQIAGQRIMLGRLQNLKASGRISLELDAENPLPPAIGLEDGDQITVPHRPSFIGVFGEVLSETSFIHKPAYTVNNYLDKAGTSRDADLDKLMVIRADGTVESNARRSSFLSAGLMSKRLNPGDTIFVPGVIDRRTAYSQFIQGAKDWTTILHQFGLGAAALKTIRN